MEANNITADTYSMAFSPKRENLNGIFASDNLENSNKLANKFTIFENMTINDFGYELNVVTTSDTQV